MPKPKAPSIDPERSARILKAARKNFGFESLRAGQEDAISAVLDRHGTLVVQPTGSGKSAIYQIAGLLIEGSTVVVSPLIALQKDQVDSINSQDAAEAVLANSMQPVAKTRRNLEKIEERAVEDIFWRLSSFESRKSSRAYNLQKYRSSSLMRPAV